MKHKMAIAVIVSIIIVAGAIYVLFIRQTILPPEIARLIPFYHKSELSASDMRTLKSIRKKLPETVKKVEEFLKIYNLRIVRDNELNPNYSYKEIFIIKDFDGNGQLALALSCFHDKERKAYALIILNNSAILHLTLTQYHPVLV